MAPVDANVVDPVAANGDSVADSQSHVSACVISGQGPTVAHLAKVESGPAPAGASGRSSGYEACPATILLRGVSGNHLDTKRVLQSS